MKYCWTTINVKNMDKSIDFYRDLIGLEVIRRFSPVTTVDIAFLGKGDTQIELIYSVNAPDPSFSQDISLGFEVETLEITMNILKNLNIPVLQGPMQPNPHVRFMFILDPNGLKIQLVENIK